MEDNPLKAKKRAQTSPETELSAEMQMMEDKFIVYDFTKVKRSQSLSRGRTMRPGIDQKISSGTLDGVVTKSGPNIRHGGNGGGSIGRIDAMPLVPQAAAKTFRPDSPSDRVGQDRFNPDEEQVSLTGHPHQQQQRLRGSPLSSPTLHGLRDPSTPNRAGNGRSGSGQQQQQQQYRQEKIGDYFQSDALMSENIILPPSSLPRPLQASAGNPATSPRNYANSSTTTPSSPSNSFGHSTLTSLATPPTSYSSSPVPQKQQGSHQSGTVLFSTPDSGTSLSTMATTVSEQQKQQQLLDSVNIPAVAARRAVRGRETSSHSVNSMPAALSYGQRRPTFEVSGGHPYQYPPHYPQYQQQTQQHQMRPMSAYTTTTTLASQDRTGTHSHRQPSSSSLYGDGGSSSSNGTLYHSNSGSSYKTGLTTVPQQYAMASYGADRDQE